MPCIMPSAAAAGNEALPFDEMLVSRLCARRSSFPVMPCCDASVQQRVADYAGIGGGAAPVPAMPALTIGTAGAVDVPLSTGMARAPTGLTGAGIPLDLR